jgi:hypothetical protein
MNVPLLEEGIPDEFIWLERYYKAKAYENNVEREKFEYD